MKLLIECLFINVHKRAKCICVCCGKSMQRIIVFLLFFLQNFSVLNVAK